MLYNLHTHTARCNHAVGEDREYVEAAIKAGIRVLGFSDHCPQFFPDTDYYSFFRMRPELASEYADSVRSLQKEYENDIKILLGFEAEYYPATFEKFTEFIKPLGLDYMIMGQHFVGNEYDSQTSQSDDKINYEEQLTRYINQTLEGLKTGIYTYIAHPDILNYKGDINFYRENIRSYCEKLKALNIPVEYNILGYRNKRCYPNPEFWKIASEVGCKTVIGYDAHNPDDLLKGDIYDECLSAVKGFGITPIDFNEIDIKPI